MRKNIDKWNHYKKILDDRAQDFISDFEWPDKIYEVLPVGKVKECTVTSVDYAFRKHKIITWFSGKNPSNSNVEGIKSDSEKDIEFSKDNVCLHFTYPWGEGSTASSGILWGTLTQSPKHFISRKEADRLAEEKRLIKEHEENLLASGHIRCTCCNKVVPEEDTIQRTMISRMYKNFKKSFRFCSEKCAAYNQMSLEG